MALVLKDRVQQTGTANLLTPSPTFTLSGSVAGYQPFSVVGDTNTTYYAATDGSGNWEAGLGTYSTTGPTLTRTTILSSSNSGSAVIFSGTVNVFLTYPSSRALYLDGTSAAINVSQAAFTTNGALYATSTTAVTSGTLPVGSGGSGATTLTGILKGNGTSAFSAATAGTDYLAPNGVLGTPTSGTLTNVSGLPLTSGVTGTLPIANGGTGTTAQISGLVKGGASAFTAATAGTDYLAPNGVLGTPTSGTLTNCSSLPIGSGVSGLGTGVATFLGTPSSANLAAAITDETGSGALVFATSPSLTTPSLGIASATSINKVTLTAPLNGSTLTIAEGKTLTASNSITLAGTDSTTMTFPPASASVGYLNVPMNNSPTGQTGNYTTVLSDAGKFIYHPSGSAATYTIPSNASVAYDIGTVLTFVNMTTAVITIAITSDTMYVAGSGTTGSRSLAQYGMATAIKMTSTTWLISGSGLT